MKKSHFIQSFPENSAQSNVFSSTEALDDAPINSDRHQFQKSEIIARLQAQVHGLQSHAAMHKKPGSHLEKTDWVLGCSFFDALIPKGLETNAIHEIKGRSSTSRGASAGDWVAAIGFAARLGVRRVASLTVRGRQAPWLLWCWPKVLANEFGRPSCSGFASLGLDPSRLIIVETARQADALNALEESLKSSCLALVVGVLEEMDLTPARRLSLAAGLGATPALLVTHPASANAGALATRWRVASAASAKHAFDLRAPGARRFSVSLERCRSRPSNTAIPPQILEWSDETHSFALASVVADHAAQEDRTAAGAGV